jgi:hypothetical protein
MQADLFAVLVLGQTRIIVTGQTLLVAHLRGSLGLSRRPGKHSEQQKKCYQPTATLHGMPRFQRTTQLLKMAD